MDGSLDGAQRNPGRNVKLPLVQIAAPDFISLHPGYLAKAVMEPHMNGSLDGA